MIACHHEYANALLTNSLIGCIYNTMEDVILDTNVVCSALRSKQGASHALLLLLGDSSYRAHLTVPLFLEYEEQVMRLVAAETIADKFAQDILDYICTETVFHDVHFLWRPFLRDADDDMVLEAAVAGACRYIVTHNKKDFQGAEKLGVSVITPGLFLRQLEK